MPKERERVHWFCKRCNFHYEALPTTTAVQCPSGHAMKKTPRPVEEAEPCPAA